MYKLKLTCVVIFCCGQLFAAEHYASLDTLVKVSGKVLSSVDSSAISATITYQKLPYYDDMGMANAKSGTGSYEMYMLYGNKYNIIVSAEGFDSWEGEVTISEASSGQMNQDFVLSPDAEHEIIKLDNLIFASGKSVITQSSYEELDELVNWLNARPDKVIQLEGHTDFDGGAVANMNLSQSRVDAVRTYLVKSGINKKRVKTKAFGGTQPLTRERTSEGRAMNRRVEVRILN